MENMQKVDNCEYLVVTIDRESTFFIHIFQLLVLKIMFLTFQNTAASFMNINAELVDGRLYHLDNSHTLALALVYYTYS